MIPLKKAAKTYADKLQFRMSKVCLRSDVRQEYLHCPLKLIVDLGKTHTDPLLAGTCGVDNLQAQPAMTLVQVKGLTQSQRFDVTALIAGLDDTPREVAPNRKVIDVTLLDASGPDGKAQEVKFGFFFDHPPNKATKATIDILRTTDALSFFALQGKKTDLGFNIESSKDFFVVKAVGERATRLLSLIHI